MTSVGVNPLAEGLRLRRRPDPCALVIFGASGDLTQRKLFPALYALAVRRLLPERFGVVGVARTEQTSKQWIAGMKKAVRERVLGGGAHRGSGPAFAWRTALTAWPPNWFRSAAATLAEKLMSRLEAKRA